MNSDYVITKLLHDDEVQYINSLISGIDEKFWIDGNATLMNSNGTLKSVRQLNHSVLTDINSIVTNALDRSPEFSNFTCPKETGFILISRMKIDDYYRMHHDLGLLGHFSTTLFLSDPDKYDGGELKLYINGNCKDVKLNAGESITYNTGTPHEVNTVTDGERTVIVFWTKSRFSDVLHRHLHKNIRQSIDLLYGVDDGNENMKEAIFKLEALTHDLLRTTL